MKFGGSYEYPTTNITHPGPNDILLGRGGGTNQHSGNVKFRKLVATHKLRYLAATKADKPSVARDVVREWRSMDPPGRFLAKVDGSSTEDDDNTNYNNNSSGGMDDSDRGGDNNIAVWYDVGEKKAREKASQCLRERNGVTNEAVAALVKTITASGEECPQDYETLMTKAALIKAQNDITLQHQHQQYQRGGSGGGGVGVGHGQEIDWGDTEGGEEGGVGGVNNYRNQYSSSPAHSGSGSTPSNEDDLIEAEIQRLLKLRQQQIRNSQQKQQQQQQQLHRQRLSPSTSSGEPQAYMGEESVLREYEQLMQKQRELNLIQSKISSMGMGMNAMNFNVGSSSGGMMMNSMGGGMGKAGGGMGGIMGGGTSNNGVQPNAAQEYMNRLLMLRQTTGRIAGVGNNNDMDQMMSSANLWNNMNMVNSSNMDLGSGGMIGGGNNSNNMNSMQMLRQFQNNNMGGGGGGGGSGQGIGGGGGYNNSNTRAGQDECTIEEYQASLQNFLSHGGGHNNKKQMRSLDIVGLDSSHRTNLDASHRTDVAGNLSEGLQMQVPANFDYGVSNSSGANKRNRRRSILRGSVDDSDLPNRNTFASMMDDDKLSQSDRTSCTLNGRNTMNSIDAFGMRNTFKSVDTMDLMSIGNSINDIVEEDWEQMTPDMRARYSRRLSLTKMSGVNTPFQNKQWGSGRFGTGRPKMSNSGDNMEQYLQVQTKDCDGPRQASKDTRNSQLTMDFNKSEASQLSLMLNLEGTEDDSRLSFMSNMSELTDFQDILSKQADEARR